MVFSGYNHILRPINIVETLQVVHQNYQNNIVLQPGMKI